MATPGGQQRFLGELSRCRRVNLDTNILIYYLGGESRYAGLVKGLFRLVDEGSLEIVISAIVQMELLVAPIRKGDFNAMERVVDLTERQPNLEVAQVSRVIVGGAAWLRADGLEVPDALIVATGIVTQCDAALTNDGRWRSSLAKFAQRPPMAHGDVFLTLPRMLYLDEFVGS